MVMLWRMTNAPSGKLLIACNATELVVVPRNHDAEVAAASTAGCYRKPQRERERQREKRKSEKSEKKDKEREE